jgi:uncharacterized protein (TIGR02996 family)
MSSTWSRNSFSFQKVLSILFYHGKNKVPFAVMTQAESLLAAVFAHPDDDGPRLVYADYLQQQGDPRGEFIAIQCALARGGNDDRQQRKLERRQEELFQSHAKHWSAAVGIGYYPGIFHRGFIKQARITSKDLATYGEILFAREAFTSMVLVTRQYPGFTDFLSQITSAPQLRTLEISGGMGDPLASALAKSPLFDHLTHLNVSDTGLQPRATSLLVKSPHLTNLQHLLINNNPLKDQGARAIAKTPSFKNLKHLDVSNTGILAPGASALVASKYLRCLEHLNLSNSQLASEGIQSMVQGWELPALTTLYLSNTNLGDVGALALARSPRLANLKNLDVSHNRIWMEGAQALVSSPHLSHLSELNLQGTRISESDLEQLQASYPHITFVSQREDTQRLPHPNTPDFSGRSRRLSNVQRHRMGLSYNQTRWPQMAVQNVFFLQQKPGGLQGGRQEIPLPVITCLVGSAVWLYPTSVPAKTWRITVTKRLVTTETSHQNRSR